MSSERLHAPSDALARAAPRPRLPGGRALLAALVVLTTSLAGSEVPAASNGVLTQHPGPVFYPDDPLAEDPDRAAIPSPEEHEASEYYDVFENLFLEPGTEGAPPAVNVNTRGEVPDSSWFTNRHGRRRMSPEELASGPEFNDGPVPGTWTIVGRTGAGVTPKFTVEDARGDVYVVKFDPLSNPEMASAAEVIATNFFHAFGYHVPQNDVVVFDPEELEIEPGATFRDSSGVRRSITERVVERWLDEVPRTADGNVRALASLLLEGQPVGPFFFHGTRSDDANDVFPHELRRELRGMRVFSAWLNHDDSRAVNTLDMYVGSEGEGHVRHHLIDFGSTLGSASLFAQKRRAGNEYFFEADRFFKGIYTFGFWVRDWVTVEYPDYPSIGRFEGDFFQPERWKPEYPNPAFERMDEADAFWAARIVARFADEDVRAVVREGRLSNPEAEDYLYRTLLQRRDKVVAHWLTRTNPLDAFTVDLAGPRLSWENAAHEVGVESGDESYRVSWYRLDNEAGEATPAGDRTESNRAAAEVPAAAWGPADGHGHRYALAEISTLRPDRPGWERPVVVALRDTGNRMEVVGIRRPRGVGDEEPGRPLRALRPHLAPQSDSTRIFDAAR